MSESTPDNDNGLTVEFPDGVSVTIFGDSDWSRRQAETLLQSIADQVADRADDSEDDDDDPGATRNYWVGFRARLARVVAGEDA